MLDPWEWTEQDLLHLITEQIGESLSLDYKESGALQRTDNKKNELTKDVSAFANAAGGVLVYGMKENGHVPTELDGGLDPNEISKEWVEQVLNSRISRRVAGVRVRQVPLSGARSGRVAYVVYIPASVHAPHMAADHRYYKRVNLESVPMEDYELRDVSRRFVAPDLCLGLLNRNNEATPHVPSVPAVEVYVENLSSAPADFALITFHLTAESFLNVSGGLGMASDNTVIVEGAALAVHSYKLEWRGSLRLPIVHGTRYHVAELSISMADAVGERQIFWELFVSGAEVRRGAYQLRREDDSLTIQPSTSEWHLSIAPVWRI